MKNLRSGIMLVGMLCLATVTAHAALTLHFRITGPVLHSTSDADTLHISIAGNDTREHIGILWFLISMSPQLKPGFMSMYASPDPNAFYVANDRETIRDSVGIGTYGNVVYQCLMDSYTPTDSCSQKTPNISGDIGYMLIKLRENPTVAATYIAVMNSLPIPLPGGSGFPPSLPWTQLCSLANSIHQPILDSSHPEEYTVNVYVTPPVGGGCGYCCTHYCEDGAPNRLAISNAPLIYYDLQGRKLEGKPTNHGLYFVRQGGAETKKLVVVN